MIARVPASSANLGPGFDTSPSPSRSTSKCAIEPADSFSHLERGLWGGPLRRRATTSGPRVAASVLGHYELRDARQLRDPTVARPRLVAALAVAAAVAAGAADPLAIGTRVDGHAENAAASLLGGLVTASVHERDGVVARPLALDDEWRFVVVVPDEELATSDARRVLPAQVPFADAVRNLNAMGLLLAGLADHHDFVASAMDDYLHQPYRMSLLPFAKPLLGHAARERRVGVVLVGGRVVDAGSRDERPRRRRRARVPQHFCTTKVSPAPCLSSKRTARAW